MWLDIEAEIKISKSNSKPGIGVSQRHCINKFRKLTKDKKSNILAMPN